MKEIKLEKMLAHLAFSRPMTGLKILQASMQEPVARRVEIATNLSMDSRVMVLSSSLDDLAAVALKHKCVNTRCECLDVKKEWPIHSD